MEKYLLAHICCDYPIEIRWTHHPQLELGLPWRLMKVHTHTLRRSGEIYYSTSEAFWEE